MIENIIEESYQNKNKQKKIINIHYDGPKEPFHEMEEEKLNNSTTINWKVKRTEKKIFNEIDELFLFSVIDDENYIENDKNATLERFKQYRIKTPNIQLFKEKNKQNKYLFKGNILMAEKINKTKIKEFSFTNSMKNNMKIQPYFKFQKESKNKFINKDTIKSILSPFSPSSTLSAYKPIKYYNISNSDCFFITKLPNFYKSSRNISKENKLKRMKKIIKETNTCMLDIYTGLKNMKQNKFSTYDDPLSLNNRKKLKKGFKNIDKINLGIQKNQSVSYINRRFRKLFQNIFDNKKYTNEKLDARALLDPLDKISGGAYKEVKLDNLVNKKLGQRIWIKKSTANLVSYGKSFQLMSDDIFYKERKRIIGIYPKIKREAGVFIPRKKIELRQPLLKKLQENVHKINNVYIREYDLVNKFRK